MRNDAIGLFWEDRPVEKVKKEPKAKRKPPERLWERPDYLPYLEESIRFDVNLFTDMELIQMAANTLLVPAEKLVWDLECYPNYFLAAFKGVDSGKVVYLESYNDSWMDLSKLHWILTNFTIVGFNSLKFDEPLVTVALTGVDNAELQLVTYKLIVEQARSQDLYRKYKTKKMQLDHIDLIEVAPLTGSLKIYSGRLTCRKMQDLPFVPGTYLSPQQMQIVRFYCVNDLDNTRLLYDALKEEIDLRVELSREYNVDLRSKSDAQIAEAVIASELTKLTGSRPERPFIEVGTTYRYNTPHFLQFQTPLMKRCLEIVQNAAFVVESHGGIGMPKEINSLKIPIGNSVYRMGIGGLHSSESSTAHVATKTLRILDRDVTSFYPYIILLLGLYPKHLGPVFLRVYRAIVERRVRAKEAGNTLVADTLKIVVNGSYGKLGSMYSILYSPDLLIQVTMTGQLSLLMLIETMELAGIPVVSANTDGIVMTVSEDKQQIYEQIVAWWEQVTGFATEETEYKALYSRDVNNYIAVLMKPKKGKLVKTKGAYGEMGLKKNPTCEVCVDAVIAEITAGVPISKTIRECKDIGKFVSIRNVSGGAVKMYPTLTGNVTAEQKQQFLLDRGWFTDGTNWSLCEPPFNDVFDPVYTLHEAFEFVNNISQGPFLGKAIRWYYAVNEQGEIVSAKSGNKVAKTEGAKPLMEIPDTFPDDVDYDWYIAEAESILKDIAYA